MRHFIFVFFLFTFHLVHTAALSQLGCTDPAACNYDSLASIDDGGCTELISVSWFPPPGLELNPDPVLVLLFNANTSYQFDASSTPSICLLPGCYTLSLVNLCLDWDGIDDSEDIIDDLFGENYGGTLSLEGVEYEAECGGPVYYEVVIGSGCAGCTDPLACNYSLGATSDDGSCIASGCTDSYACNFSTEAECDDGSCDYSCCPGPGCCSVGHYWDWEVGKCFDINPADINLDGCVQLNDLLDLLSAYGDCSAEESDWQCGDPLEYQGYDYETVQIGEQCWFAENLRAENYRSGDEIFSNISAGDWVYTSLGCVAVYGESGACDNFENSCDPYTSLDKHGRLYNWYCISGGQQLCPFGWGVPTEGDFDELIQTGGGLEEAGGALKSAFGWYNAGNGSDNLGFNGKPGGLRWAGAGEFLNAGSNGDFWTSTESTNKAIGIALNYSTNSIGKPAVSKNNGFSIRCIKDAE